MSQPTNPLKPKDFNKLGKYEKFEVIYRMQFVIMQELGQLKAEIARLTKTLRE